MAVTVVVIAAAAAVVVVVVAIIVPVILTRIIVLCYDVHMWALTRSGALLSFYSSHEFVWTCASLIRFPAVIMNEFIIRLFDCDTCFTSHKQFGMHF